MVDIFTDSSGNGYHFTMPTASQWTVSSGGLPNGDNYVTGNNVTPAYNTNGDDFDFRDGTGWTTEVWGYYTTGRGNAEVIFGLCDVGTSTLCWTTMLDSSERWTFQIYNTGNTPYLSLQHVPVVTASTWYHVVGIKDAGSNTIRMYVNGAFAGSTNVTSGTARTPTGTFRLYLGGWGNASANMQSPSTGFRISKASVYNAALTPAEVNDHYLAMVAA